MRTFFRGSLALLCVALLGAVTSAAQIIQTFNMPVNPTDISGVTGTGTFDYFQSAAGYNAGDILTSVDLRIAVTATLQALDVTNNDQNNQQTFSYLSYTNIVPVGTAPNADKSALNSALFANGGVNGDIDLIDTGNVLYNPGQTIVYAPPAIVGLGGDSLFVAAASIVPYDTTGSFTLGFNTTTFQSFVGGGGNGSNSQSTDAIAAVTVIYNYTPVPEPTTLALAGLGAIGLALAARSKRKAG